uniref:Putative restriction alleviation protein n=1 Tax=viral metagenome TaxID=1070528 RepID=A0A6H1ZBM9_9ZZZZ
MTQKLKLCPFCGEKERIKRAAADTSDEWSNLVIKCLTCKARGPECTTWTQAEESWNKREKGGDN